MPMITFVAPDGVEYVIDARGLHSVMEAARNHMVPGIDADCGGSGSCATCHVHVDAAWAQATGSADDMERAMLDCVEEPSATSRLSCQIRVSDALDGLVVRLPARQG
ncbi:2Fe-2S iron-sulfur cluster-binding protein [Sphingomonas sp. YL-JM2C]